MSQMSDVKMETWKNLPVLVVRNEAAEATIALHGAHVLSYKPIGERDLLWLSKETWAEPGKPIRGGIPVYWPWFGPAKEPAHGLARIAEWVLKESICDRNKTVLKFESFASDNLIADITITVSDKLIVELKAVKTLNAAHEAQLINYLKTTGILDGMLINFGSEKFEAIKRISPESSHTPHFVREEELTI